MTEQEVVSKLKDYASILNSLYSYGVVRTYNSPVGRENNNQLFANTVRMKMKNTVDATYGDVEPGVFLYDVIHPNEDMRTE